MVKNDRLTTVAGTRVEDQTKCLFPVILWMVVMSPSGSPVVTEIGTFSGGFGDCRQAAETARYLAKQCTPASVGFICIEKPK
jgi:hypothetical protein